MLKLSEKLMKDIQKTEMHTVDSSDKSKKILYDLKNSVQLYTNNQILKHDTLMDH